MHAPPSGRVTQLTPGTDPLDAGRSPGESASSSATRPSVREPHVECKPRCASTLSLLESTVTPATAVVDDGSFDQHRAPSPVVHLSRVEWEHVASFLHVDGVLALRSVSRHFYRTASDPRIWLHLLGRDMPSSNPHLRPPFKKPFADRLSHALSRDTDEEENTWRALTSPSGQKTGRDKCLREEYGALRFALWRVLLTDCRDEERKTLRALLYTTRGDVSGPNHRLKVFKSKQAHQDVLDAEQKLWRRLAPTDRRDAAALHHYVFDSTAIAATKKSAESRLAAAAVLASIACGLTMPPKDMHPSTSSTAASSAAVIALPVTSLESPTMQALAEACRVQAIPAPMHLPLLGAAGMMVALSAVQASQRMPKVRNAALKSSAMLRHRVVCHAAYRCMNVSVEASLCRIGRLVAGDSAVGAALVVALLLLYVLNVDPHRKEIPKVPNTLTQGDNPLDITEGATRVDCKTRVNRAAVIVLSAVSLAAVVVSAWKAHRTVPWLQKTVLALPLPQRAIDAVAVIPSGNFAWSAAWTLMVAVVRCRSASFDESLDVYKDGLTTPFSPKAFPDTPEDYEARLNGEEAEAEENLTKAHGAYLFVDEVIGSVAELSMRAAGCPAWLGVTFRTAVAAIQCATEMYVARIISPIWVS